ncbi:MAG TPA: hypothetical protein VF980_04105 [Thermoanaerobaculia bacterium]
MSVSTLRRIFVIAALLLSAQTLLAAGPSARTGARMVFDESTGLTVLFSGVAPSDLGTVTSYNPADLWLWNGSRWVLRYPDHAPPGRSSHIMVYDSARKREVIFGGTQGTGTTDLNDTWAFSKNDWTQIETNDAPAARSLSGAAYDRARDRIVLFGGVHAFIADKIGTVTTTNFFDTWEFDGTDWTKVADNGPQVIRPLLVYDEARNQILMIGENDKFAPLMYSYDTTAHTWNQVTPATMPPCTNESAATFQRNSGLVFLVGGVCTNSTTNEEAFTWDGTNWTTIASTSTIIKASNQALTFDAQRNVTVMFGGTEAFGLPRATTFTFDPTLADASHAGDWVTHDSNQVTPGPRSLLAMRSDPVNKVIYMLDGLTDGSTFTDFWIYQNGVWQKSQATGSPSCGTPNAAFDTDRGKLVAVCNDSSTFEWDGTAWKAFPDIKTKPGFHQFSAMVYDQSLKKTVLFGGFDGTNWMDNAWMWDGTTWTEQRKNRAPARDLTQMWFDPILHKTVLFGGLGRRTPQDRVERFSDMWTFDANGWTELKPPALPTTRFGAMVITDPSTGHTLLFGGMRYDTQTVGNTVTQKQFYANDMWEWDGTTWAQRQTTNAPPVRESAGMEFDYERNQFVVFGGWSGYYLSDTWTFDGTTWHFIAESIGRTRLIRH